jgi:splicing factor 3A subunit 2
MYRNTLNHTVGDIPMTTTSDIEDEDVVFAPVHAVLVVQQQPQQPSSPNHVVDDDQADMKLAPEDPPQHVALAAPGVESEDIPIQFLVATPHGRTAAVNFDRRSLQNKTYEDFCADLLQAARARDLGRVASSSSRRALVVDEDAQEEEQAQHHISNKRSLQRALVIDEDEEIISKTTKRALVVEDDEDDHDRKCPSSIRPTKSRRIHDILLVHDGRIVEKDRVHQLWQNHQAGGACYLSLKLAICGGIDRQNRVGSKFGGGGVSSSQQGERERKERLKQLALESIDLAKDPYLMRNHLGTYECKLCLTLHTNEANYLSHTQGKKHQQGLARRAHMEKLREEKEGSAIPTASTTQAQQPKAPKVRIGRPAYQVFKSRDADTHQRCLSFELGYPEIEEDLQPRHRFMSAYEQRVESPPDRRYQYLLFAAEPYETVAFKIPNEGIDKGEGRFVTHWDADEKKFTVTLYFVDNETNHN